LAFVSEKILHGKPSGIDNSVSTFGGFVRFSGFKPSPIELSSANLRVLLVNTQVKRNTKALVEMVAKQYQVGNFFLL
jgi:mevalonate kinase